jgi:tetratricopeptide (TPR) repeat protein
MRMSIVRVRVVAAGVAAIALALSTPVRALQAKPAAPAPRSAGTGAPANSAFDQLAKRAADARAASRFEEAIDDYRQALKVKPDWVEGRFVLGTLLYEQDKYEPARDEFRRVSRSDPKNGLVLALKGLCEFQLKNYERALGDLVAARELGIASEEVFGVASFHAAILHNRFEQYEQAFDVLKDFALRNKDSQAVIEAFGLSILRLPFLPSEAPPEKREMILMAGRAGFQQARGRSTPVARQFFDELTARYPAVPNVHYAYGVCLLVEDPSAALEEFRRELRISPTHYHAMLQIAFELLKQGQFAEARDLAEKALELSPNLFAAHNALGRAYLELGDADRAIQELEKGASLAPDSPEMYFSLARAYAKKGRTQDAANARATFLRLDKARRTSKTGPQSVGGMAQEPEGADPLPDKN